MVIVIVVIIGIIVILITMIIIITVIIIIMVMIDIIIIIFAIIIALVLRFLFNASYFPASEVSSFKLMLTIMMVIKTWQCHHGDGMMTNHTHPPAFSSGNTS